MWPCQEALKCHWTNLGNVSYMQRLPLFSNYVCGALDQGTLLPRCPDAKWAGMRMFYY